LRIRQNHFHFVDAKLCAEHLWSGFCEPRLDLSLEHQLLSQEPFELTYHRNFLVCGQVQFVEIAKCLLETAYILHSQHPACRVLDGICPFVQEHRGAFYAFHDLLAMIPSSLAYLLGQRFHLLKDCTAASGFRLLVKGFGL